MPAMPGSRPGAAQRAGKDQRDHPPSRSFLSITPRRDQATRRPRLVTIDAHGAARSRNRRQGFRRPQGPTSWLAPEGQTQLTLETEGRRLFFAPRPGDEIVRQRQPSEKGHGRIETRIFNGIKKPLTGSNPEETYPGQSRFDHIKNHRKGSSISNRIQGPLHAGNTRLLHLVRPPLDIEPPRQRLARLTGGGVESMHWLLDSVAVRR